MNFIFSNLNTITLAVWLAFFVVVAIRMLRPLWVKSVSYGWIAASAVALHFLYGVVATFGQYRAWATGSDFTRSLLSSPLSADVPFPPYIPFVRPLFDGAYGYFAFYSFQRFFLSAIALLVIVGLFLLFIVARSRTHPINFREGDISIIVLAMLISGWPGVIVLLPIGFICTILLSVATRVAYGTLRIPLAPAFLVAAPFALIFATPILTALHLYSLLKV